DEGAGAPSPPKRQSVERKEVEKTIVAAAAPEPVAAKPAEEADMGPVECWRSTISWIHWHVMGSEVLLQRQQSGVPAPIF
ncbi:hypothetical protein CSPX01_03681, partial [Colletotrichum filicis]